MNDNIDKNEIRRAIDRLQIEHPCNIAYDPIAFVNMEAVNTIKGCVDKIAKRMAEDTEINIICEFAKLYLEGVRPILERPHGEWIEHTIKTGWSNSSTMYECSTCRSERWHSFKWSFCPVCGTKMEVGDSECGEQ